MENFLNSSVGRVRNVHARALYPLISLLNHSCVPNLRHVSLLAEVEAGGEVRGEIVVMQVEAQRPVLAGKQLNIRYAHYTQVTEALHASEKISHDFFLFVFFFLPKLGLVLNNEII